MEKGASREEEYQEYEPEHADIADPNVPQVTPTQEDLEASAAIEEAMKALWAHADETGEIFVGEEEEKDEPATEEKAADDAAGDDAATDRGEGAIYCEHCDIWLNGPTQWDDHKIGKKHKKNCKKGGHSCESDKKVDGKVSSKVVDGPGEDMPAAEEKVEDPGGVKERQEEQQLQLDDYIGVDEEYQYEAPETSYEEEHQYEDQEAAVLQELDDGRPFASEPPFVDDAWLGYTGPRHVTPPPPPPMPTESLTRSEAAQRAIAKAAASKGRGGWTAKDQEVKDRQVPPPPPPQPQAKEKSLMAKLSDDHEDAAQRAANAKLPTWEAKPDPKVKEKGPSPIPKAKIKTEAQGYARELDDLAVGVLKVLHEFPQGLLLSQVKPHLQAKCSVSLSEASFGCSKLQEVFRMPPLDKMFPMKVVPR
jgi:hypothetical protein